MGMLVSLGLCVLDVNVGKLVFKKNLVGVGMENNGLPLYLSCRLL